MYLPNKAVQKKTQKAILVDVKRMKKESTIREESKGIVRSYVFSSFYEVKVPVQVLVVCGLV